MEDKSTELPRSPCLCSIVSHWVAFCYPLFSELLFDVVQRVSVHYSGRQYQAGPRPLDERQLCSKAFYMIVDDFDSSGCDLPVGILTRRRNMRSGDVLFVKHNNKRASTQSSCAELVSISPGCASGLIHWHARAAFGDILRLVSLATFRALLTRNRLRCGLRWCDLALRKGDFSARGARFAVFQRTRVGLWGACHDAVQFRGGIVLFDCRGAGAASC
jgi:hypothetical protein